MPVKPPFLFRVASKQSRGVNTATDIDPLVGYDWSYHDNADAIGYHSLRAMVYDHVKYNYAAPSEFSSWSISLLYVLALAIRKMYYREDNLLIYVMDTRNLASSRIHCSADLLKTLNVTWAKNLLEYSVGEYLIHGRLEQT